MKSLTKNKYLSDEEYQSLIEATNDDSRNSIMIRLALETGARASEILGLNPKDLDHNDLTIHIKAKKGSNDRYFPLSTTMYNKLKNLPASDNGLYFDIGYIQLRRIWDFYRPVQKTFHSTRHTFAVRLYNKHKDLKVVQLCLGHRSLTTTAIYLDFIYSKQELRRLICPE